MDLKDGYLHIPIVKHHHHFFIVSLATQKPYQWKVVPFGLAMAPKAFPLLKKPIYFLYFH